MLSHMQCTYFINNLCIDVNGNIYTCNIYVKFKISFILGLHLEPIVLLITMHAHTLYINTTHKLWLQIYIFWYLISLEMNVRMWKSNEDLIRQNC